MSVQIKPEHTEKAKALCDDYDPYGYRTEFIRAAAMEKDIAQALAEAEAKGRAEAFEEAREAAEQAHAAFLDSRWPDTGDRPSSPPASLVPHWWAIDHALGALRARTEEARPQHDDGCASLHPEGQWCDCSRAEEARRGK